MSRSCASFLCCCCSSSSNTTSKSNNDHKTRLKHALLEQLHIYGILLAQIIASAVLITVMLWLFIRLPEPEVHLTGLDVDGLSKSNPTRTLLHYNMTLHNPDRYKSINYDVLVMRITYSGYHSGSYGATVNFLAGNNHGISQSPGATTPLANHTVNYTDESVGWDPADMIELKTIKTSIHLKFVMEVRFIVFTRVIATRQMMRTADVYFDDDGVAFIHHHRGLKLK